MGDGTVIPTTMHDIRYYIVLLCMYTFLNCWFVGVKSNFEWNNFFHLPLFWMLLNITIKMVIGKHLCKMAINRMFSRRLMTIDQLVEKWLFDRVPLLVYKHFSSHFKYIKFTLFSFSKANRWFERWKNLWVKLIYQTDYLL